MGNSSPAPRFYGLPKIHKANCPMHPIVSACRMAPYQLAKFLTKILQRYTGMTPSFVKDSKSFSEHLRSVHIGEDEELVSFDVSALFTSILVPTALDVINHLFCEHIKDPEAKHKYSYSFRHNTIGLEKDEVMQLLKLVLENCVFTFQDNSLNSYTVLLWVPPALQWLPTFIWSILKTLHWVLSYPYQSKIGKDTWMMYSVSYPKATGTQCSNT